jgi:hypothetical protein
MLGGHVEEVVVQCCGGVQLRLLRTVLRDAAIYWVIGVDIKQDCRSSNGSLFAAALRDIPPY